MDVSSENIALAYDFLKELYESNVNNFQFGSMPKNMGEISVLGALDAKGGTSTSGELSTALSIKTARMAALLKALEEKGQIIRRHPKDDKRITEVSLTELGKKICNDSIHCIVLNIAKAYETIGKDEMNQFKTTLLKLCKLYQKGEPAHA